MRPSRIAFLAATILALSSLQAFAQQAPSTLGAPPPEAPPAATAPAISGTAPLPGTGYLPGTTTGLDKVANDGISTKTVKAVPCSTTAKETDGFTTCIGITDDRNRSGKTR
jgi:hypothetical protein